MLKHAWFRAHYCAISHLALEKALQTSAVVHDDINQVDINSDFR
jgi:hypothetical protein